MNKEFYKNDINEIIQEINKSSKKLKNKKILLVGSNGFLGKYFVEVFKNLNFFNRCNISLDCYDNFISSKKIEFLQFRRDGRVV